MGIESYITDPLNHNKAHIDSPEGEKQGLIVSTRPLKEYANLIQFFSNPVYGVDLNINASISAESGQEGIEVIEEIYNGGDTVEWTPSIVSGAKWTVSSPDTNHTQGGQFSLKYDNGAVGDTFQLASPSGLFSLASYQSLVLWVNIGSSWTLGDSFSIYGYDTGTSSQIGTKIFIENFINIGSIGIWQKVTVPLSLMGLLGQTIDAIRIEGEVKVGTFPTFYVDDIQFEGVISTGGGVRNPVGPQIFEIKPSPNQWYHIHEITTVLAVDSQLSPNILANATVPYLDYTKFLGLDLENGVIYQRIINNRVTFAFNTIAIGDVLGIPNTFISLWGDEHTTFLQYRNILYSPLVIKGEEEDILRIFISDNLSPLLRFRASVGGKIEYRERPKTPANLATLNRALL